MPAVADGRSRLTGPMSQPDPVMNRVFELLAAVPQAFLGLLPRTCHRLVMLFMKPNGDQPPTGLTVLLLSVVGLIVGFVAFNALFALCLGGLIFWANTFPGLVQKLADAGIIDADSGWLNLIPSAAMFQVVYSFPLVYATGLLVRAPYDAFDRSFFALRGILWFRDVVAKIVGMLFMMGLGLLPLGTLLMMLPLVMPQEAVLTDTLPPARNRLVRGLRRALAVITGMTVLLALLVFGIQAVSTLGLKSDVYATLANRVLPSIVIGRLPEALVAGWPFVFLIMYAIDFAILFFIGKVPLQYNFRNLRVRWVTSLMTAVAFTVVVFLLVMMMSFVDSVNRLTSSSGVPGNVFVMSDGSTDELFSRLEPETTGKLELEKATTNPKGEPLKAPIYVKTIPGKGGQPPTRLISKETYYVINQEIAKPGAGPKRRFVQLRGVVDAEVSGRVHDIQLLKGDWFGREGAVLLADGTTAVPCVLGEGAAQAFGSDYGKDKLDVGDLFKLGDLNAVVVGVMKSAGKTFDSETWATSERVAKVFGKQSYTTVVIRVADDNPDTMEQSATTFATHLTTNFADPRVRAVSETRYYEDLAKSNSQLMYMVVGVAVIMALGGVIGVMLVMFAAISQRIKDIGVMRVVGYKRWQILVSFMLESLTIALVGGLIGVMLVLCVDAAATAIQGGLSVSSTVTGGQGGGKTVVTKLYFGFDVVTSGILFTIVMGRLGGLLPSISAMRLGILDSLR